MAESLAATARQNDDRGLRAFIHLALQLHLLAQGAKGVIVAHLAQDTVESRRGEDGIDRLLWHREPLIKKAALCSNNSTKLILLHKCSSLKQTNDPIGKRKRLARKDKPLVSVLERLD